MTWDGEGLPPVGTVCEHEHSLFGWCVGTVIAHHNGLAIFFSGEDDVEALAGGFRRHLTPEQIAAEEREAHVAAMLCYDALGDSRRGLAEALYDAGYRK